MPNTTRAALPYPASSSSPNIPQDIQNLATALDAKVIIPVANQAARDALSATSGLTVFRLDTGDYESYYGTSWARIAGPPIHGKMWRTGGSSAALTAGAQTKVAFDTSRTTGGITFSNASDTLTVPRSGYYEIRARGYATGGPAGTFSYTVVRNRTSVSDLEIILSNRGRKIDAEDEPVYASDTLPLQSGDALYLRCLYSMAGFYWGVSEFTGVFLSVTFASPLFGATPV